MDIIIIGLRKDIYNALNFDEIEHHVIAEREFYIDIILGSNWIMSTIYDMEVILGCTEEEKVFHLDRNMFTRIEVY